MQIPRGSNGGFAVQARINGIAAAMVVDTGSTSVVLTYETAKAVGLPIELLEYNVDVQTASGQTKAARLWLDRMAIGKLVERAVPALVVPRGQMKTNLLGMSFLDRLDSFEVRSDSSDAARLPGAGCFTQRSTQFDPQLVREPWPMPRIEAKRNYLQGFPWLDAHHFHREAPPDQQDAGRSLMLEVDAAGSGYDPSATFGPSTTFGLERESENSVGSRGDPFAVSASPAPLGTRSTLAGGLTSASRRRSAGGAGLAARHFSRRSADCAVQEAGCPCHPGPGNALSSASAGSRLVPQPSRAEQRWLRRASLVRYLDTRPARTFLLHQVEEYCGVMRMQAHASMRCGSPSRSIA